MLRDHCNEEELEAHRVLDLVRAGFAVPEAAITRALFVLGDAMGLTNV